MLHEKVIEVTLQVRNPINFCSDKYRHVLTELRNTYVGRCYKGAYIVRVKELVQVSDCRLATTNISGEGVVDVQFIAEVLVFSRWDILVGVQILSVAQVIIGQYKSPGIADDGARDSHAVVSLMTSGAAIPKAEETIAVGQRISVRVQHALHQPMQAQASVFGSLLTCDRAAPALRLRGSLDPSAAVELAPLLDQIEAELVARTLLLRERRADVWFFEWLLYSYRPASGGAPKPAEQSVPAWEDGPTWEGPGELRALPAGAASLNILDIANRVVRKGESYPMAGVRSRALSIYRSSRWPSPRRRNGPPP